MTFTISKNEKSGKDAFIKLLNTALLEGTERLLDYDKDVSSVDFIKTENGKRHLKIWFNSTLASLNITYNLLDPMVALNDYPDKLVKFKDVLSTYVDSNGKYIIPAVADGETPLTEDQIKDKLLDAFITLCEDIITVLAFNATGSFDTIKKGINIVFDNTNKKITFSYTSYVFDSFIVDYPEDGVNTELNGVYINQFVEGGE